MLLIFDGQCVLCLRAVETLRSLPCEAEIDMVPLQQNPLPALPCKLTREQLQAEIHVIETDGTVFKGADALIRILRTVPSLRWLEPMYRVPGLRPAASFFYKWIAKHRYRLFGKMEDGCENSSCRLHSPKK